MDFVHEMEERKGVDLSGPGRWSTEIYASDSSFFAKDYRATRQGRKIARVAYRDSRDIGDRSESFHFSRDFIKKGKRKSIREPS